MIHFLTVHMFNSVLCYFSGVAVAVLYNVCFMIPGCNWTTLKEGVVVL